MDLVRNSTAFVGTGPVTLGAAVDGYTGFGQACVAATVLLLHPGHRPRDRERSRARNDAGPTGPSPAIPLTGPLTDFRPGIKTIALVAAAEWFDKGVGWGPRRASTVVALAALAATPGKSSRWTRRGAEGRFRFDASNLSAKVAADPRRACMSHRFRAECAAGAWCRIVDGGIDPRWFGLGEGEGEGVANSAAVAAMLGALRARATTKRAIRAGWSEWSSRRRVSLRRDDRPRRRDHRRRRRGRSAQRRGDDALLFPDGVTGIRCRAPPRPGDSVTVAAKAGAGGSIISG